MYTYIYISSTKRAWSFTCHQDREQDKQRYRFSGNSRAICLASMAPGPASPWQCATEGVYNINSTLAWSYIYLLMCMYVHLLHVLQYPLCRAHRCTLLRLAPTTDHCCQWSTTIAHATRSHARSIGQPPAMPPALPWLPSLPRIHIVLRQTRSEIVFHHV